MTANEITEFLKSRDLPYPDRGDSDSTVLEKFGEILCLLILEKEKLNGHVDTDWVSRNSRGGLGVTLDELQAWLELCARTKTHADDELVYRYMPLLIDIARTAEKIAAGYAHDFEYEAGRDLFNELVQKMQKLANAK